MICSLFNSVSGQCPLHGVVKINYDVAIFADKNKSAIGMVI